MSIIEEVKYKETYNDKMSNNAQKQTKSRYKLRKAMIVFIGIILVIFIVTIAIPSFLRQRKWKNSQIQIPTENLQSISFEALLEDERSNFNEALLLINTKNPLPEGYKAKVGQYNDSDVYMNDAIQESYGQMSEDIFEQLNEKLYIMDAYRTHEEQEELYFVDKNPNATVPGASEHEAGLALDVYVEFYAGKGFLKHEVGQYVQEYCQEYGFIIRYPFGKSYVTGIGFEPWHIRYVGQPHANILTENKWTLEEYFESHLKQDVFYKYGNFIITRQNGNSPFTIPDEFEGIDISPDNMGSYVLTIEMI